MVLDATSGTTLATIKNTALATANRHQGPPNNDIGHYAGRYK
jgi:hypothetical protein